MAFNRTKVTPAVTPTIITGGYVNNDALSAEALEFEQGGQNDGGLIVALSIYDARAAGALGGTFRVWLFNAVPTAQTAGDALALAAGDFAGFLGWVDVAAGDWDGRWCYKDGINLPYECGDGLSSIWAAVEVTGSFTWAAADNLRFKLHIAKD